MRRPWARTTERLRGTSPRLSLRRPHRSPRKIVMSYKCQLRWIPSWSSYIDLVLGSHQGLCLRVPTQILLRLLPSPARTSIHPTYNMKARVRAGVSILYLHNSPVMTDHLYLFPATCRLTLLVLVGDLLSLGGLTSRLSVLLKGGTIPGSLAPL